MLDIKMSNPKNLHKPVGPYSQVSRVKASELVFIAGQTATDIEGKLVGAGDFEAQCKQIFANLEAALQSVGASVGDLVKITTFVVGWRPEYLAIIHEARQSVLGSEVLPASSLIGVESLVDSSLLIEVEGIAVTD